MIWPEIVDRASRQGITDVLFPIVSTRPKAPKFVWSIMPLQKKNYSASASKKIFVFLKKTKYSPVCNQSFYLPLYCSSHLQSVTILSTSGKCIQVACSCPEIQDGFILPHGNRKGQITDQDSPFPLIRLSLCPSSKQNISHREQTLPVILLWNQHSMLCFILPANKTWATLEVVWSPIYLFIYLT